MSNSSDSPVTIDELAEEAASVMADEYAKKKFPHQLNLPNPAGTDTLWRYIDFTQYASLIQKEQLHFSRPDQFDDKFEGSLPAENIKQRREWAESSNIINKIIEKLGVEDLSEEIKNPEEDGEFDETELSRKLIDTGFETVNKMWLEKICLNCWHKEPEEKAAMWDLYSKGGFGIVIKSSYNNILASVDELESSTAETEIDSLDKYLIGEVDYIDYDNNDIPDTFIHPFFYKRKSFEHEKEVRIAHISDEGIDPTGKYIDTNINDLIHEVRLEPESPKWFEKLVKGLTDDLGYDINIERSELEKDPAY